MIPIAIGGGIALILGVVIVITAKFFDVPVDEKLESIKALLPGAIAEPAVSVAARPMPMLWLKENRMPVAVGRRAGYGGRAGRALGPGQTGLYTRDRSGVLSGYDGKHQ